VRQLYATACILPHLTSGVSVCQRHVPVSSPGYGVVITIAFERGSVKLYDPIDRTASHRGPARFFGIRGARYDVRDILPSGNGTGPIRLVRQKIVATRVRNVYRERGVPGYQLSMRKMTTCGEDWSSFGGSRVLQGVFVFGAS